ncbi:mechanosensitive ion channel domain-containing protein [Sulfitobacter donghicola]|uniref:Small-conductance mechanosensitive channel n=1 Tax=Sulfitobacter donghicola DSW-25 = KCTC 12864 = JCM 14565 TaxID=1300350 RepID=A0A073IGP7_9RHOB|nr:mechanosensitive ion channel domain-containing protein [Sulfitobacter donghicola]KEJ88974.1 mechanosensitive ion channel MscS [Sulfitobacter donghicola DSW-25 = KCTC 12864 = JCM 14565]KIN67474.1 MscS Mechanosensitive ion channel [Sulfitobacter donghicola DSW-25 = KCTC 12864 = JCM 14565]
MRLIALLLCLALPIAVVAQTSDQPSGTITIEDNAAQDAAIANRIRDILAELDGFDDVTVTVSSGIVTLRGSTLDTPSAQRLNDLVGRVQGVVAIENDVTETTDVVQRLNPAVERFKARGQQLIAFLPLAGIAISLFVVIVWLGFAIARRKQPWNRLAPNAFIADIYRQVLRLGFVIGGLVVALDVVNATALLSGILGAAGIVGLAIGFAVRDTVENFIASIMLSIRQPFRPNDTVEIEGDTGKVIRLTSRATILLSFDGNHIRIPNSTVFKSRIVNFSRNEERRFTFQLSLAPEADLAHGQALARATLEGLPFVLKTPKSSVWIESVGDSWVTMGIAAWINQNDTSIVLARSEAIRLVQATFDTAGIAAPAPTYRLLHAGGNETHQVDDIKEKIEYEGPDIPPPPPQDVDALEDKQLEEIVALERAEEHSDLLRENADQE